MSSSENTVPTSPFLLNSVQHAKDYLDDLVKDREECDRVDESSKDTLYKLLAKCLRFYELLSGDNLDARQLRFDFDNYVKSSGLKFQKDSHTLHKIAGVVFHAKKDEKYDRRRASAYGQVLRIAEGRGTTSDVLVKFIRDNAGIEGVRKLRSGAKGALSAEKKAENAYVQLSTVEAGTIAVSLATEDDDRAFIDKRVVLLATQKANSTFVIHGVVKAASIVDSAFATKYKPGEESAESTKADPGQQAQDLDQARAEAVAEASA